MNTIAAYLTEACSGLDMTTALVSSYIHLVPVIVFLPLAFIVYIKSRRSLPGRVLFAFILCFSLWLLGDYVTWNSANPHLIYASWAFLDYVEIVFFVLGLYLSAILVRQERLSLKKRLVLIALIIAPLVMVITGTSVQGLDAATCEALNNTFLTQYKLWVELALLAGMLYYFFKAAAKKGHVVEKWGVSSLVLSLTAFLAVFGVSEYLASSTREYTIHLYALFILPVFLLVIVYSIFELHAFGFKVRGTPYLVATLVILIGGQLFLIESSSNQLIALLGITFFTGLTLIFASLRHVSNKKGELTPPESSTWKTSAAEEGRTETHLDPHSKTLLAILFAIIVISGAYLYWRAYVSSDFVIEQGSMEEVSNE